MASPSECACCLEPSANPVTEKTGTIVCGCEVVCGTVKSRSKFHTRCAKTEIQQAILCIIQVTATSITYPPRLDAVVAGVSPFTLVVARLFGEIGDCRNGFHILKPQFHRHQHTQGSAVLQTQWRSILMRREERLWVSRCLHVRFGDLQCLIRRIYLRFSSQSIDCRETAKYNSALRACYQSRGFEPSPLLKSLWSFPSGARGLVCVWRKAARAVSLLKLSL
jgi:hypothetical protein